MSTAFIYAIVVLVWGSTWYAITLQMTAVPMEWSLVYRFAAATCLLLVVTLWTGNSLHLNRMQHIHCFGMGLFLFSLNYYFTYGGYASLSSGHVAVVYSTLPVVNALVGWLFYRTQAESATLLAAMIGVVGVFLVFLPEFSGSQASRHLLLGIGSVGLAVVFSAIGNVIAGSRRMEGTAVLSMMTWGCLYGTSVLVLIGIASGGLPVWDPSGSYVMSLVYLSAFGTVLAFLCYLVLIRRMGAARAAYVSVALPIVALLISAALEGYVWTPSSVTGVALVAVGNAVILRGRELAAVPVRSKHDRQDRLR